MGAVPAQKALQESKTKIRELLEVTREKNIFSEKGPMNCPTDKSMIFTKSRKRIMVIVATLSTEEEAFDIDKFTQFLRHNKMVLHLV